jgi:hypothetical protein
MTTTGTIVQGNPVNDVTHSIRLMFERRWEAENFWTGGMMRAPLVGGQQPKHGHCHLCYKCSKVATAKDDIFW